MASGVKVADGVFNSYQVMKLKKKHRYMVMKIENGFIVEKSLVERSSDQEQDFKEFVTQLPKDDCCYVLLDLVVPGKAGCNDRPFLFLITWCPDSSKTKDKMVYAASKQALLDKIREGTKPIQANDISDLVYQELLAGAADK